MVSKKIQSWITWSVPMFFCGVQFALRLFPGNIQYELMEHFRVDAASFGVFAASYYIGYAGMQIPIAMLMERFGVRLILFISVLICSLGCFLMAITSTWPIAVLSRFLIGIGSVSGFLGTTKVIVDHFDSKYHATMIGFSMSFGLLGTLFGGKPIISMVHTYSWQKVSCAFGLMNGVIALLAWGVMKNKKKSSNKSENEYFSLSVVLSILKNKTFLTIAIANFLMEGCLGGFADVWGQQYLRLAFDIDKSQASWLTSSIFLGMLFGPPLLSLLAQKTHAHFKITGFCGLLMAGIFSTLLLGHDKIHAMWFVQIIMLILGALSGYQVLVFVIGESLFPKNLSNISIATLNCINMFGGTFFHSSIGLLIHALWNGHVGENGQPIYSLSNYKGALLVIPITAIIGGLMLVGKKLKRLEKY